MITVFTLYVLVNGYWTAELDYKDAPTCQAAVLRVPDGLIARCKEHKVKAP